MQAEKWILNVNLSQASPAGWGLQPGTLRSGRVAANAMIFVPKLRSR